MADPGRVVAELERRHPDGAPIEVVRAPGRVNLIGEHTDYNEGFVLPAAIDLEVVVALRPSPDRRVELTSLELGETESFALDGLEPGASGERRWIDYPAGTAWALRDAGLPVRGLRGVLASSVPIGSGLSSSAALELASAWALLGPTAARLGPDRLALLCQRAENEYVGVRSGIMDQYAGAAGVAGHAVLIDCRTLEHRAVPLPAGLAIVICDTGSTRRLESSAYNRRREECEEGVRIMSRHEPGVRALRDVDPAMLARHRSELPDVVARRCEHVVEENRRVLAMVSALEARDPAPMGPLMAASHASLRDLYEVSSAELDAMVEIVAAVPGVVGTRMTGAGFGGCTVALVEDHAVERVRDAVFADFPRRTGLVPRVHVAAAAPGAGPFDLPRPGGAA